MKGTCEVLGDIDDAELTVPAPADSLEVVRGAIQSAKSVFVSGQPRPIQTKKVSEP